MIIVKIELHSARTGAVTELGRMRICNLGGQASDSHANYSVEVFRKGTTDRVQRTGTVERYPRKSYQVWELIQRALAAAFG